MNPLINQFVADYLSDDPRKQIQMGLVKEMTDFADKADCIFALSKARRVYTKAYLAGKFDLAKRIKAKYGPMHTTNDATVAMGWALMAARNDGHDLDI